ncbi:MAG: hypothetical protein WBN17_11060, partial [Aureibaculum sp.]
TESASFEAFHDGYFTFILDTNETVVFEEVNQSILEKYNLKDVEFRGKIFELTFSENIEDLDDEDFVIYRLEKLNQI